MPERQIKTAREWAATYGANSLDELRANIAQRYYAAGHLRGLSTRYTGKLDEKALPVVARVEHGRWLADC